MLKIQNKIYISWDDVNQLVDTLCEKVITEYPNIDSIFGLKRGGLIPAVMASHRLGLPLSDVMYPNTLVIDDICDSGKTIFETQKYKCFTATIHHKQSAITKPDFYYSLVPEDKWIVYPWENKNSKPIPDYATERK
jgi:hypoxanthine phosphoribosyltransferase